MPILRGARVPASHRSGECLSAMPWSGSVSLVQVASRLTYNNRRTCGCTHQARHAMVDAAARRLRRGLDVPIIATGGQVGGVLHTDVIPALAEDRQVLYLGDLSK